MLAAKFLNIRKKINNGHRKTWRKTGQGINARCCYKQSQNLTWSSSSYSWRWEWESTGYLLDAAVQAGTHQRQKVVSENTLSVDIQPTIGGQEEGWRMAKDVVGIRCE